MAKRNLIPNENDELLMDLENLRALRSHCGHDLRSKLGAVTGVLELLLEDEKWRGLGESKLFQMALTSATEALDELDLVLARTIQNLIVIWSLTEESIPQWSLPKERVLYRVFESQDELIEAATYDRPNVLVVSAKKFNGDVETILKDIGLRFVRIYWIDDGHAGSAAQKMESSVIRLSAPLDPASLEKDLIHWLHERRSSRDKL